MWRVSLVTIANPLFKSEGREREAFRTKSLDSRLGLVWCTFYVVFVGEYRCIAIVAKKVLSILE